MADESNGALSRDQQVNEVIAAYLEAVSAGQAPDRQEFLARYRDLAPELEAFFADHDRFRQLIQPPFVPPHPGAREGPSREAATSAVLPAEAPTLPPSDAGTDDGRNGAYSPAQPPTLISGDSTTAGPPLGTEVRYIGDYELLEELGRGGMGVVFKAWQSKPQRLVALKMILAGEYAGPQELARFRSEGEAVARLQHPHIVEIFEVGEHKGQPYFSLEFCAGGSLEKKLRGTPLPPREAAELLETLARAMHAAHQAGVIHRDLKPANVLFTAGSTPKITDFGLAKKVDDTSGQTASGTIMGTPSYMAPEQASGKVRELGPACDIYSLGAVLYELVTGRPPFRSDSALDTIRYVIEQYPAPPRLLNPLRPWRHRYLWEYVEGCLRTFARRTFEPPAWPSTTRANPLAEVGRGRAVDSLVWARPDPARLGSLLTGEVHGPHLSRWRRSGVPGVFIGERSANQPGERDMNRFVKVLLLVVLAGPMMMLVFGGGRLIRTTAVATHEPPAPAFATNSHDSNAVSIIGDKLVMRNTEGAEEESTIAIIEHEPEGNLREAQFRFSDADYFR